MNRREFLATTAAASAAPSDSRMIGIQAGAVSFLDEGVDPVLDNLQSKGAVNSLFLATFTYGRGIAGRQVPGQPLPDHGKQEYDTNFRGGCFTRMRPEYYRDTVLKDVRARDHGDFDILEAVLPAARKRGMKTYCWFEDVWRNDVPGIETVQEIDHYGRRRSQLCLNHPEHRAFLAGITEDWCRNYEIDGIMWGSERHGGLGTALGANHGGRGGDPEHAGCFCEFCLRKARERGLDGARAKSGFRELEKYVRAASHIDGNFVEFLRLSMRYPEILAWEQLWHDSLREIYALIYNKAKSVKPAVQVGWHIWHNNSFSPLYRAQQDLKEIAPVSDYLKMVMYHNCGGERLVSYLNSASRNWFGDLAPDRRLPAHYDLMHFRGGDEKHIQAQGLPASYVEAETKRALAAVEGLKTRIWPGIDIDIPTAADASKSTPQGTFAAVQAALRAGAPGVLLSRKYSEMKLANLAAAGDAVRG